jgi:hypothetical protein
MPNRDRHCPFLNAEDGRCAEHQTLGRLDETFKYCLSAYSECPAYAVLAAERKAHRSARANAMVVARQNIVQVTVTARPRVGVWRRLARMILPRSFSGDTRSPMPGRRTPAEHSHAA